MGGRSALIQVGEDERCVRSPLVRVGAGVGNVVEWAELGPVQIVADRLAALYSDEWSLRRLLALAKVEASRIPFDGISANMAWFTAVEAARQGRLLELVGMMLEEYPLDPWLVGIYSKL